MTFFNPSEIRSLARTLPVDQTRAEVRIMAFVITLLFAGGCLRSAFLIASCARTALTKVTALSHEPLVFVVLFMLAAAATVPHLWALAHPKADLSCKWPRKLATGGTALAGLVWAYLGNLSIPLDAPTWPYFAKSFACVLLVGGVYAFSLNSQQVRQNENPAIG